MTERNSGYFINIKSRPCVSRCPGVELSDCNTIAPCYCKQDVLYCYCCPFREEFSICDLQPSDREQRSQDVVIENKFASSNRDSESITTPGFGFCFCVRVCFGFFFFCFDLVGLFFPRRGKNKVVLVKDRIKSI